MAIGFFDGQKADASPESIKRKRAMIAQLLSGGRAPRDVGEGLNAIGRGLQAAVLGSRADAEERANEAERASIMGGINFGGAPMAAVGGSQVAPRIAPSSGSSQSNEPTGAPSTALAQTTSAPDESVYGPVMPPEFFQVAGDLSDRAPFAQGQMESPQGLVIHHTGGRGTPEGIMDVFRQRGLATQYVMDRDGKVFRSLPEGTRGRHLRPSEINNLSNSNALGIEIIARDDADVTPQQRAAAQNFTNYASSKYGFNPQNVFGHGELNSHKQSTEGMSAVADWRTYKGTGAPERSTAVAAAQPRTMQDRTLMAYAGGAREPGGSSPFDAEIRAASQRTGIPESIIRAKIQQESGFNPAARGGSGEVGLAQILPSTAARPGYGVQPLPANKLADPAANINFGAQYLAARGRAAGVTDWNDPNQAARGLTAYNGGGDPNYAANVLRYLPNGGATPVPLARQGIVDQGADGVSEAQYGALDAGGGEPEQVNTGNIFSPFQMGSGNNPFLPRQPVNAPPAQPDPVAVAPDAPVPVGVRPAQDTVPLPAANIAPPQSPFVPPDMRQPIAPMEASENGAGAMQFIESEFARREGRPDPRSAIGAPPAQIYNAFVQQPTQAPQMPAGGGSMPMGGAPAAQAQAQPQGGIITPEQFRAAMTSRFTTEADKRLVLDAWNQQQARAQAEADRARVQADNVRAARAAGIDENLLANPVIGKAATEAKFREAPETFRNLTPAERLQNNIDPNDRRPYQISNKTGKVSGVGGTQIFNNMRTEGAIQPGYRAVRDPQGNVERIEPIPGSQQERDIKEAEEKKGKSTAQDARYANVIFRSVADIDQNMKGSWFPTTGSIGQALSGVAGTNAHNVARAIEAIKANIGFERLSAMRAASPTGGALGGIAVKELDLLTASAGNLEQSQSADQFRRNLERLRSDFEMVIHGRTFSPEERKRMAASEAAQADQGRARPNFIDQNAARPQPTPAQSSAALQNARKAIADGAPREAVMDRLRQAGIDPGGL